MTFTRTHKLLGMGLFVLTFGCKGAGSAAKAVGLAAVTTAHVASAVAASGAREERAPGGQPARGEVTMVAEAPNVCTPMCPVRTQQGFAYVCGRETPGVDEFGMRVTLVSCP